MAGDEREERSPMPNYTNNPDLLHFYLRDIRPISSLLTPEEEQRLARQFRDGKLAEERLQKNGILPHERKALKQRVKTGERARQQLFMSNTRLVISIAKRYQGLGLPLPDLVQEGNLGLMKAIERFDPDRGVRLSTYATWWIRQTISRAAGDKGRTIRLPINQGQRWNRLRRTSERLMQKLGHEPSLKELADATDLSLDQVTHTMKSAREPVPIDELVGEEEDRPRQDLIADDETENPEDATVQSLLAEEVQQILSELPPREEQIIKLRFGMIDGETYSMAQIGKIMGYSRERIRQLQHQALDTLRGMEIAGALQDYLD